jgi:hypothetical protein
VTGKPHTIRRSRWFICSNISTTRGYSKLQFSTALTQERIWFDWQVLFSRLTDDVHCKKDIYCFCWEFKCMVRQPFNHGYGWTQMPCFEPSVKIVVFRDFFNVKRNIKRWTVLVTGNSDLRQNLKRPGQVVMGTTFCFASNRAVQFAWKIEE